VVLSVDNPLGTQSTGSLPVIALSTVPLAAPCGLALPGWGMDPAIAGELLIVAPYFYVAASAPWAGPGSPGVFPLPVPQDGTLLGASVSQGALVDFAPAAPIFVGLTRGLELALGT
jgi:hypothetical protein